MPWESCVAGKMMCSECGHHLYALAKDYSFGCGYQVGSVRHFVKPDGKALCGRCEIHPDTVTVVLPHGTRLCSHCHEVAINRELYRRRKVDGEA